MNMLELQQQSTDQFKASILADSVNVSGNRLTTWEVTYPRIIHAEGCRHRVMARNTASSRAIPIERCIDAVVDAPFLPMHVGAAQKGMQAFNEVEPADKEAALEWIYTKRWDAISTAQRLSDLGVHKQVANRYLEPYLFITEIISTTSFRHFELLRDHPMAEPHIQHLARLMSNARKASVPELLIDGQWHLPLIHKSDRDNLGIDDLKKVSVARCARVSYVRQNDIKDYSEDFALYERLVGSEPPHLSCTEHQATPLTAWCDWDNVHRGLPSGCFIGWKQHRQEIEGEFVPDEPYTGPTIPYCTRGE